MTDTTSAPLCWGQRWAWHEQQLPFGQRSPSIHLTQTMLLPDDVGAGAIRDALNRVITRHPLYAAPSPSAPTGHRSSTSGQSRSTGTTSASRGQGRRSQARHGWTVTSTSAIGGRSG